jgi:hypothetical protein
MNFTESNLLQVTHPIDKSTKYTETAIEQVCFRGVYFILKYLVLRTQQKTGFFPIIAFYPVFGARKQAAFFVKRGFFRSSPFPPIFC